MFWKRPPRPKPTDFILELAFDNWPDGALRIGFQDGHPRWHTLDD